MQTRLEDFARRDANAIEKEEPELASEMARNPKGNASLTEIAVQAALNMKAVALNRTGPCVFSYESLIAFLTLTRATTL